MISDLEKLSEALDNSTLSSQIVSTVTQQKDWIATEIAKHGSAIVSVRGRQYRVRAASAKKPSEK